MASKQPSREEGQTQRFKPNLDEVNIRYRHMHEAEVTLDYGSYTLVGTSLGTKTFSDAGRKAGAGSDRYNKLDLTVVGNDLVGTPTLKSSQSTVDVNWSTGGHKVRIDMTRWFMAHPFPIPKATRAHIPVFWSDEENGVMIQLSAATFHPIETKKSEESEQQPSKEPAK